MPWTAAAIVGSAALGAAASNRAAKAGEGAAEGAQALSQYQYDQTRADQEPWRQAGTIALNQLVGGIGGNLGSKLAAEKTLENFDPQAYLAANPDVAAAGANPWQHYNEYGQSEGRAFTFNQAARDSQVQAPAAGSPGLTGDFNRDFTLADFQKDPGYGFRLNQGLDAVQGSRAARGSMMSGATLKALQDYGSDYASSEFGKAYDRFNNNRTQRFNRLATIAGIGQTATNNVGTAGANFANTQSSNLYSGANASAAGSIGVANAIGSGLSNLQSLYQLNQMNRGGGGYAAGGNPAGYYEGSATGPVYVP